MSYPVQWPQGTSPEWLLEKIQQLEILVIRSRKDADASENVGDRLGILSAWNSLGQELEVLEHKLGSAANVSIFFMALIHNMLSQETVDLDKVCKDLRFEKPQKVLTARTMHELNALDLFLDNAERDY